MPMITPARAATAAPTVAPWTKCRLCTAVLDEEDDFTQGICRYCVTRPEARRLDGHRGPTVVLDGHGSRHLSAPTRPVAAEASTSPRAQAPNPEPRAFTPADRSLIRGMHAYLPAAKLLEILNERQLADLGPRAALYTLDQLQAEIRDAADPGEPSDWAGLRRLLAEARRAGLLATIAATTIEDFAVVYQLAPAQLMHLRDVIHHAQEGR